MKKTHQSALNAISTISLVPLTVSLLMLPTDAAQSSPDLKYTTSEQWRATGWSNKFMPIFLNLYKLKWHDEFNRCDIGTDLRYTTNVRINRPRRWYAGVHSFGLAKVVNPSSKPSPFSCYNGILSITLSNPTGEQWVGGELRALSSTGEGITFNQGYAEARIKFPKPPRGLVPWASFWFLSAPRAGGNQTQVELDVVEPGLTSSTDIEAQSTTIHEWPDNNERASSGIKSHVFTGFRPTFSTFDNNWHTYGFEKLRKFWVVFRDGIEFGRFPVLGDEMNIPVFPLLDVALHFHPNSAPLGSKYSMEIDYVRIYEPKNAETAE